MEYLNDTHLVSNGLDLIPTLCDYAGIDPPTDFKGLSFRRLAEGREPQRWRDHLWIESEFGYMVEGDRYKYMPYDSGKDQEQLMDLEKDPGEIKNMAEDPAYRDILNQYRQYFRSYQESADETE
jgi:arylsulfatase A-like enzyme